MFVRQEVPVVQEVFVVFRAQLPVEFVYKEQFSKFVSVGVAKKFTVCDVFHVLLSGESKFTSGVVESILIV